MILYVVDNRIIFVVMNKRINNLSNNTNVDQKICTGICNKCGLFREEVSAGQVYYVNKANGWYDHTSKDIVEKMRMNRNIYCKCLRKWNNKY